MEIYGYYFIILIGMIPAQIYPHNTNFITNFVKKL